MNSKKGVSSVIATVLIILITVAAVAVLWRFVIPMIQDATEGSSACVDAVNAISVVSYNLNDSGELSVAVMNMGGGDNLKEITISCVSDTTSNSSTYNDTLNLGETKTYTLNGCGGAETIRLAPIIELSSGSKKVCDYLDIKI